MKDIYYPENYHIMAGPHVEEPEKSIYEGDYTIIYDFMLTELDLTASEIPLYALIYSYTKSGTTLYATKEYLAHKFAVSERTIYRWLESLREKGVIIAGPSGTHSSSTIRYEVNRERLKKIKGLENIADSPKPLPKRAFGHYQNVHITLEEYVLLLKKMGRPTLNKYVIRLDKELELYPELKRKKPNHYATLVSYFEEDKRLAAEMEREARANPMLC